MSLFEMASPTPPPPVREMIPVYACTNDEKAVAACVAERRNSLNRGGSNLPVETASNAERLRQHVRGCLAEIAVSRILNRAWTGCGKGSDGCRDVGDFLDVRSVDAGTSRGLLVRDRDPEVPIALVAIDSAGVAEILGWERPSYVRQHGRILDENTGKPCWILPVSRLRSPEGLLQLG